MTCIDFHTLSLRAAPGCKMSVSQESASLTFCINNKLMLSLLATLAKILKIIFAGYNMNRNMCCLFQQIFMKSRWSVCQY